MSEGKRLDYKFARGLAIETMRILRPVCERIEIAGSLRRNKPDVGDIEIVCIPKEQTDLFGNTYRNADGISEVPRINGAALHKDGEHFKQINLLYCMCDLFITTPECWGVIFMIRTGSADFSHKMVTPKQYGGYMPGHLKVKDGRLWIGGDVLHTPEEKDVFEIYGMEYINPEMRR
jgi:DNA polymerase/3'-5' exonuclease PolX